MKKLTAARVTAAAAAAMIADLLAGWLLLCRAVLPMLFRHQRPPSTLYPSPVPAESLSQSIGQSVSQSAISDDSSESSSESSSSSPSPGS